MSFTIKDLSVDDGKAIIANQEKRFKNSEFVGQSLLIVKEINELRKQLREFQNRAKNSDAKDEIKKLKGEISVLQSKYGWLEEKLLTNFNQISNRVHESVPISKLEKDNVVVRKWGSSTGKKKYKHQALLDMIDGCDSQRGSQTMGHRGYYLTGMGVLLNQALINYGLSFLVTRGYKAIQPSVLMSKEIMKETAQLSDFDDQLYKVIDGESEKYLIATSEQPISAFHRGETLLPKNLPLRYAGFSSCFRKEAGAHGRDEGGIFRVHQFEKIEQFCIVSPQESWTEQEKMITLSEEFYQSLQLPYQIINIVSGELNDSAAKKYDLEAWFPGSEKYRELVSCSNCTDYQSRRMKIKYGVRDKGEEIQYVHMLNSTLCATERTLCCIVENYQTETGIVIPDVLQPYMGREFIPFVKQFKEKRNKLKSETGRSNE